MLVFKDIPIYTDISTDTSQTQNPSESLTRRNNRLPQLNGHLQILQLSPPPEENNAEQQI